ncbi:MAG: FkbM family methyltransferase [Sulfuritalea sp.]|nr:FkbM family methyltransferase [Sulfuritalea sp.]
MTPRKAIVVSGCNSDYFHYLRDLLHSFFACGAAQKYDFGVIDGGLAADQLDWLRNFGVHTIVKPDWPISGLEGQPEWYKVCIGRPFFPNFFPAWDVIVYLDSDTWLQNSDVLDAAVEGARQDGFAALPITDRSLWPLKVQTNVVFSMQWHMNCLEQYFGPEIARQFQLHPILSGSLFAGRRDAPHWAVWQQLMAQGLRRKIYYDIDQASMTLAVHQSNFPTHFLPLHHHWIGHLGPIGLDTRTATYVEPYLPHHPISSISLAAHSKTDPVMLRTTDGRTLSRLLRYGQQGKRFSINVALAGGQQIVDGIASPRFRQSVFDAIGSESAVRFLQIGAMDGVSFDPMHAAVRRYGWSGTFVEPMPEYVERLRRNMTGLPNLNFVQAAIGEASGRSAMHRVRPQAVESGRVPPWAAGLSSLVPERTPLSGKGLTAEQHQLVQAELETVEVDCLSFADFEAAHGIAGFDVLLIDTEGYDWKVLSQIDLARHAPKCVHMEILHLPPDEIAMTISLLSGAGYACYAMDDGNDLLALRHDFGLAHFHMI